MISCDIDQFFKVTHFMNECKKNPFKQINEYLRGYSPINNNKEQTMQILNKLKS